MEMEFLFKERNILYNILCFLITENEKVFNRSDAKLYWRTVLHVFCVFHHAYIGVFGVSIKNELQISEDDKIKMLYTFRAAYLTGWNFLAQTGFLFLALSHDVLEWLDRDNSRIGQKIRYYRDVLFLGIVVPYTCFVFAMFWVLYAIDRELVFPAVYDQIIPWWFNQCVHTNILVLVVAEHVLQPRRRPTDEKLELIINAALGIAYAVVYYSIYFFANRWLYNVFGIMTWWQVCLFQIMIWTSSYVFYRVQFPLNRLIHGPEPENEKTVLTSTENNQKSNGYATEEDKAKNGEHTTKNGEFKSKNAEFTSKNGEFTSKNGEFTSKNGEFTSKKEEYRANGEENKAFDGDDIDSKLPFSSKSWSLKYRNMRQSENTNL